jgi:hypothetical protein
MPWQEGLRKRPRCPSLLKCLFIVMTVYSSNVGGEGSFGAVREVVCRVLGLRRTREVDEEKSTKTRLRVVVNHYNGQLLILPPLPQRRRLRISPQAFPLLSCFLLQHFQYRIPRSPYHHPLTAEGRERSVSRNHSTAARQVRRLQFHSSRELSVSGH